MAVSDPITPDRPKQSDLDTCVHCGLCLNACPTYRELGVEMDSPRGRIYQMAQVAGGAPISHSYIEHIGLCLACRGCETACPSGVRYGRLVEAARAEIEPQIQRPWYARWLTWFFLPQAAAFPPESRNRWDGALSLPGQRPKWLVRVLGFLPAKLRESKACRRKSNSVLLPLLWQDAAGGGAARYRVAFLGGCIANICFARLNEATVRVLQERLRVSIPGADLLRRAACPRRPRR